LLLAEEPAQLAREREAIARAEMRLLRERRHDERLERGRHAHERRERRRRALRVGGADRVGIADLVERTAPREHLVEHHAERVDVRRRAELAAEDLLRRRVAQRADELALRVTRLLV